MQKSCAVLIVIGALLWSFHAAAACTLSPTENHTVVGIGDGRTLILDDGTELRLASLLAPTAYDSPLAIKSAWPAETAARKTLAAMALHKDVAVAFSKIARDRYGRRMGQVLLRANAAEAESSSISGAALADRWLQGRMVRSGHARVLLASEIETACARMLLAAEAVAETSGRGMWQQSVYQPKRAEDVWQLLRYRSTMQIVQGVVARVAIRRSIVYLNFGDDWRRAFSVKLSRRVLKRAGFDVNMLRQLHKAPVRVRGWIEKRNGPMITVWRLEQIELLTLLANGALQRHIPPRLLTDITTPMRSADTR